MQKVQSAEGISSGTTVTVGNSATSGDAYATVNSTSATVQFDNTAPAHGLNGFKIATGATAVVANCLQTFTAVATCYGRTYLYSTDWTSSQNFGIRLRAATTQALRICFDSTGHITFRDTTNSNSGMPVGSVALSNTTYYRIEFTATPGTTTTGAATANVYLGDSLTLVDSITTSTANLGTASISEFGIGLFTATANASAVWYDDTVINDTGFPGPAQVWLPNAVIRRQESPALKVRRLGVTGVPLEQSLVPQPPRARMRALRLAHARASVVPPVQIAVAAPAYPLAPVRARLKFIRFARRQMAMPPQAQMAPSPQMRARLKLGRLWRGHQTMHVSLHGGVPAQSPRARAKAIRPTRVRIANPVPAQVAVIPPNYVAQPWRIRLRAVRLSRPQRTQPVIGQDAVLPIPRLRARFARLPRGRTAQLVPVQVPVAPAYPPQSWRSRIKVVRYFRGRQGGPIPAQVVVPPVYVAVRSRQAVARLPVMHRGRLTSAPAEQLQAPAFGRVKARAVRIFRGAVRAVVPTQSIVAAPIYPPQTLRARLKFARVWRGRGVQPVPAQVVVPPVYVPQSVRARFRALRLSRTRGVSSVAVPAAMPSTASYPRPRGLRYVRGRQSMSVPVVSGPAFPSRRRQSVKWFVVRRPRMVAPPSIQVQPPIFIRVRTRVARIVRALRRPVVPVTAPVTPQSIRARRTLPPRRTRRTPASGWMVNTVSPARPGGVTSRAFTARLVVDTSGSSLTSTTDAGKMVIDP